MQTRVSSHDGISSMTVKELKPSSGSRLPCFHPRARAFLEQHRLGGWRVDAVRLARRTHGLAPLVPRRPRGSVPPTPRPSWPCACCLCAAAYGPLLAWRLFVRRCIPRPPACAGSRDVEDPRQPPCRGAPRGNEVGETAGLVLARCWGALPLGLPNSSRPAPRPSRFRPPRRVQAWPLAVVVPAAALATLAERKTSSPRRAGTRS